MWDDNDNMFGWSTLSQRWQRGSEWQSDKWRMATSTVYGENTVGQLKKNQIFCQNEREQI